MGRNLYILASTLFFFALVTFGISFTNVAQQPGSPGDQALWRMMAIAFLILSMVVALAGTLSSMFSQAERRAGENRPRRR